MVASKNITHIGVTRIEHCSSMKFIVFGLRRIGLANLPDREFIGEFHLIWDNSSRSIIFMIFVPEKFKILPRRKFL
jgi:hypothetical protein